MPIGKNSAAIILSMVLFFSHIVAQPAENPQTFCNPLNLNYRLMGDVIDAREAADPVMILFKGDYFLFASRSGGYWTSTDLQNWSFIKPMGVDLETYAPGVIVMRDTVFYTPSASGQIYKTGDPKSGVWQSRGTIGTYGDPDLFQDDDGRLYMYYGLSNADAMRVVELDTMTFVQIGSPVVGFSGMASQHGWERRGDDNLLDEQPWVEGSWMVKANNKYYWHYSVPGTEFKTYADGIYTSDSPKGPFTYAPYSPFSLKSTGFITGAGHGCTFKDKDGRYWRVVTMVISVKHIFERRLGIYPVAFDGDGHIHANTVFGDYPQYYPGVKTNPINENFAGMMLLSYNKFVTASSSMKGYEVEKSVDEESRTYWAAQTGGDDEWLMIDLGKQCDIEAIQVNFGEHGTTPAQVRGRDVTLYEQYTIEMSNDGQSWSMLVDKSANMTDVPHDYIELASVAQARYIRLNNVYTPGGGKFVVRDLRVFGNSSKSVFTKATNVQVNRDADGRNAVISWTPVTDADGYILRYGIASDKLYNNYIVYDADSISIHSLNKGVNYFFDVEAFDNGTENYQSTGEYRSFQSGNWNDVATWERNNGTAWVHPAATVPALTDGPITIKSGQTITVSSTDSIDQMLIDSGAVFVINSGVTFKVKDGMGIDLAVMGTVKNAGTIFNDSGAIISFFGTGLYKHEQNGGSIPVASWKENSTCELDSITTSVPLNEGQNFYNFTWKCPTQASNLNLGWQNGPTIFGTLTVSNTNWNHSSTSSPTNLLSLCGGSGSCTINNIVVNGYNAVLTVHEGAYSNTVTVEGNITLSNGGMLSLSNSSSGLTSLSVKGSFAVTDSAYIGKSNLANLSKFIFSGSTPQKVSFPLSGVSFIGAPNFEVESGATFAIDSNAIGGTGSFVLKPYAILRTTHAAGVNGNILCTGANGGGNRFHAGSSYIFNGIAAQTGGSFLPDTVGWLMINNSVSVTLSKGIVITDTLDIAKGTLIMGSGTLRFKPTGTLKYSGSGSLTTSDVEFPSSGGPANIISGKSGVVTLHASRTISGYLNFLAGKFTLGANTLTASSVSNPATSRYVVANGGGMLKLSSVGASQAHFPIGTASTYTPVWITNSGTIDAVEASVSQDAAVSPYGGRIKVRWNLAENTEGGGNYTLQFGWINSLEDNAFKTDRVGNARIFHFPDSVEVGTGEYTSQLVTQPFTVSRAGITTLGSFSVGKFANVTGVEEQHGTVPTVFRLEQNFPNPFNPATLINYSVPRSSYVILKIYNLLGQEVATLFEGIRQPGNYTATFNGGNIASGVYAYRLNANGYVSTKKMILMK